MKKQEFLDRLGKHLPEADREERLSFYSEMIDDRMEEGLSEEEAVKAVGSLENILADTAPEKPKKQWQAWEIVLLVLGAPVWGALLIAAIAVVLSLYVSLWALVIALWAVFVSLAACAFAGAVSGAIFMIRGYIASGIALVGAGMVCAGLAIVLRYGCLSATNGTVLLAKKLLKKCFARKENGDV